MYLSLLIAILYLVSFLLIWGIIGYPLVMLLTTRGGKEESQPEDFFPQVTVIVPTYNEEENIGRRIRNLAELDYPKERLDIVIIDSASRDRTLEVAREAVASLGNAVPKSLILQQDERKGKSSALNFAKDYSQGEIILVADANSAFNKEALRLIVRHFRNPKVGAVSGRYVVTNPDGKLTRSESVYWGIQNSVFMGESQLDSVATVSGTISAWRKSLFQFSTDSITEDLDLTVSIRRQGFKIKYEPRAFAYEVAASTVKDQISQRKRTSIGTIQCMLRNIGYFIVPRNWYSGLIFPSHKTLPMLSPFFLISVPLLYLLVATPMIVLTHFSISLVVLGLLLFVFGYLNRADDRTKSTPFRAISETAFYFILNEYIILLAWKDYLMGRYTVLWEKVESTRRLGES
jgi:cellulose synthase/poly-beta-1,6-N-acetylglucosamine synthase-like glycosyltransferase